jgi:hypothetical protein
MREICTYLPSPFILNPFPYAPSSSYLPPIISPTLILTPGRQRTLNYINAELRMREVEDLALKGGTKDARVGELVKKDGESRVREMEDEDKRWERESAGNPRWGEGRTAHHYGK